MAVTVVRAQVTIPANSGLSEDAIVNAWHFIGDPETVDFAQDLADVLVAVYDSPLGGAARVASFLSSSLNFLEFNVALYDLADAEPRAPFYDQVNPLVGPSSGTAGVREVALCMSFQGPKVSGLKQANRRGRIFFGPFGNQIVDRPNIALRTALTQVGEFLLAEPGVTWAVYSPTMRAAGSTVLQSAVAVTDGWVDDAWDTQRRRGLSPTTRFTFS